ncbi:MAG: archaellin/type IV pilin N-terminal domain-containing protein [Candidatus Woesearchaeota archaeon]
MRRLHTKKGVLGVETLIIFIAMILVAAIAAGVILRTQSVLQQRALAVGNEARERLVTGIEIVNIQGYTNKSAQTINDLEFLIRLRTGSYDIQLADMGITLSTAEYSHLLVLQQYNEQYSWVEEISYLNETPQETSQPLKYYEDDEIRETIRLLLGTDSPDNISAFQMNLSTGQSGILPLGIDFSNTSQVVDIYRVPIHDDSGLEVPEILGFLTLRGSPDGNDEIDVENGNFTEFRIESDFHRCQWDYLVPNYRFCYVPRLGNDDSMLEPGELLTLRYRLSSDKEFTTDYRITFYFAPKGGSIDEYSFNTPYIFPRSLITLWP